MIFEELSLYNFGIYKGNHTISLDSTEPSKPIILIGALNGAGKTTFLDALQLALYGKNARCSNRGKLSYSAFLERNINTYSSEKAASVKIKFRHGDDTRNAQTFEICRKWDKTSGKDCKEIISVLHNGQEDLLLSENWDDVVNDFIPQSISELFFFDGEKIENIADPKRSAEFLKIGIEALLGLESLSKLTNNLNVIKRRKQEKLLNASDNNELELLKAEIEACKIEKQTLIKELEHHSSIEHHLMDEFNNVENKLLSSGADRLSLKSDFDNQLMALEKKLFEVEHEQMKLFSGTLPLSLLTKLINECNLQLSIEKKYREFKNAENLIIEHQQKLFSAVKNTIDDTRLISEINNSFTCILKELREDRDYNCYLTCDDVTIDGIDLDFSEDKSKFYKLIEKKEEIREEILIAQQKLSTIPKFEDVRHLIEESTKLKEKKSILDNDISELNHNITAINDKISVLMNKYDALLLKINAETFEKERQGEIVNHINALQEIVSEFNEQMVHENITKLESRIKSKFDQLKRKNSLVERLEINPKDFSLTLYSQGKNILDPERLSAGERQLFAISILWGLADCSGKELPTIIDTPMGRLDGEHRVRLIKDYFPQAASQVILLSTDEEIYGNYYEYLAPAISQEYTIVYDDHLKSSYFSKGYLKVSN